MPHFEVFTSFTQYSEGILAYSSTSKTFAEGCQMSHYSFCFNKMSSSWWWKAVLLILILIPYFILFLK